MDIIKCYAMDIIKWYSMVATGCRIFRQVKITINLVETWHTRFGFRSTRSKPCNRNTTSPKSRFTSLRRIIPVCESKNTSKKRKDSNSIAWMINQQLEVGVLQTKLGSVFACPFTALADSYLKSNLGKAKIHFPTLPFRTWADSQ